MANIALVLHENIASSREGKRIPFLPPKRLCAYANILKRSNDHAAVLGIRKERKNTWQNHGLSTPDIGKTLEEAAMRYRAENADDDDGHDQSARNGLQEDSVLNLAQGRLLDPDLAVKDFADDVAPVVLGDPRFVFVAIAGGVRLETIVRVGLEVKAGRLVIRTEELPRTQVTVMHAVQDDTHALPGRNQR
jgi:hypothetical protein